METRARQCSALCQELEPDLRELGSECRKKFGPIREQVDWALGKLREQAEGGTEFPVDVVMRVIQMACETSQPKLVLLSLTCLQRLIHRRALKEEMFAMCIKLLKEQAMNGDDHIQLKVLQTVMATPADMTLMSEAMAEQVIQVLYVLHNSASASVHHTACACFRQLAEHLADQAAAAAETADCERRAARALDLREVSPAIQRTLTVMPVVSPTAAPATLPLSLRIFYLFFQDLCVMADHDASSINLRYAVDANERMKTGWREGYWLSMLKFPRPLCLELLSACIAARPEVFLRSPECFALLRKKLCGVLYKNLKGCFDFAVLVRSIHILQQIIKSKDLAHLMATELQTFLQIMLDLTSAERSPWQRATSLEFLKSVCEDATALVVVYEERTEDNGPTTFLELVNSLSKLMHQVCFSSGMDSGALLQLGSVDRPRHPIFDSPFDVADFGAAAAPSKVGTSTDSANLGGSKHSGSSAKRSSQSNARLLLLMSEAEPPSIQPSLLVLLVVECVFAMISTLYNLLSSSTPPLETAATSTDGNEKRDARAACCLPLTGHLTGERANCREMLTDCWASLLSALSLLLHGTADEAFLQQSLRCLQTLLFCCSRLKLDQARDALLLQLTRYMLPGQSHDSETTEVGTAQGTVGALTSKNNMCCRALLSFCHNFGALLGVAGWGIVFRSLGNLELLLAKAPPVQGSELSALRGALDSLFESTALLPDCALSDIVDAIGQQSVANDTEATVVYGRLAALCKCNADRLLIVWDRVAHIIFTICASDQDYRGELRGAAAAALCRIVTPALRKGALTRNENPEEVQRQLMEPLEKLVHLQHEEIRARVCEGLLSILQAYGQELLPSAWAITIRLVTGAAQLDLERAGVEFYLPRSVDSFSPMPEAGASVPSAGVAARPLGGTDGGIREPAREVMPTIFQLLELLVHDFMEYVPVDTVPSLTASIGAFGRYAGLGVNSSLTAVGFLWNVADALARYQQAPLLAVEAHSVAPGIDTPLKEEAIHDRARDPTILAHQIEDLWIQIFTHLRVLAVDERPEVRNSALKSLTSALISHGRKVGTRCYQRCLREILMEVPADIQKATLRAQESSMSEKMSSSTFIVHHSRNSQEKLWNETIVLGLEGVRRVLCHFAEEAGVAAFIPLAYALLLQIQGMLRTLTPEVSGAAFKALVDLMRVPASTHSFRAEALSAIDPALPVPAESAVSIWMLGWTVLWQLAKHCTTREVPEPLMETFVSALGALRNSHCHAMTVTQGLILLELELVLVTTPSHYVSTCQPLRLPTGLDDSECVAEDFQGLRRSLNASVAACLHGRKEEEREIFLWALRGPEAVLSLSNRTEEGKKPLVLAKAAGVVQDVIDENKSRNLGIQCIGAVLTDIQQCAESGNLAGEAEEFQAAAALNRSPTHRTMLHISSARLQHVQGIVFGHIEETQELADPMFTGLFLSRCCATFLDLRFVLLDTNKIALAYRTLCLLVIFCRRVVLQNLAPDTLERETETPFCRPEARVEALISAMPSVFSVITSLAGAAGTLPSNHLFNGVKASGLWKVAVEAFVYLVEDTLPVLQGGHISGTVASAYWQAVRESLDTLVSQVLSLQVCSSTEVLVQACSNLLVHKLLACSAAPHVLHERAVQLLGELVSLQRQYVPSDATQSATTALGHLFNVCECTQGSSEGQRDLLRESAAALAGRGAQASLQPPANIPNRSALLRIAAPVLLRCARDTLTSYATSVSEFRSGPDCQRRTAEVLSLLARLRTFAADEAVLAAASPELLGERAQSACQLAGTRALALALLPQLASAVGVADSQVAVELRFILQDLAGAFGL